MKIITAFEINKILKECKEADSRYIVLPRKFARGDKIRSWKYFCRNGRGGRVHKVQCKCNKISYRRGWQVLALQMLGEGCAQVDCAYTSKYVRDILNPINLSLSSQWKYILLQDPSDVSIYWGGTLFVERPVCSEQYGLELFLNDIRSRDIRASKECVWIEKLVQDIPWDKDNVHAVADKPEGLYSLPPQYVRYHDHYVSLDDFAEHAGLHRDAVIQCLGSAIYSDEAVAELLPKEQHRGGRCIDTTRSAKNRFGGL